MKGTFFNKPLEWNLETIGESWQQGAIIKGTLRVKNHGTEPADLKDAGVALAVAEIKKVHSRTEGALKIESSESFKEAELSPSQETSCRSLSRSLRTEQ